MRLIQFIALVVVASAGSAFAASYYDDSRYSASNCYYDAALQRTVCPGDYNYNRSYYGGNRYSYGRRYGQGNRYYSRNYSPGYSRNYYSSRGSNGYYGNRGYSNRGYYGRDYSNRSYYNGYRGRSRSGVGVNIGGFGIGIGN